MKQSPRILLLGAGYSLEKLSGNLVPSQCVLTTTSPEKQNRWQGEGRLCELASLEDSRSLKNLFDHYPTIETVIDSIPPLREGEPEAGVKNLLATLPPTISRVFYLSTTGVYGKTDGSWVTEETPCTPLSPSSEARIRVESLYRKHPNIQVTAFRLSGIYGPGRGVGLSMKRGSYTVVEGESRFTNRIHVEDICGILQAALQFTGTLPPVLNVSDDEPTRATEVVDFYRDRFNIPQPKTITREQAQKDGRHRLVMDQRVSNKLVKKVLSYSFRYPSFREGAGTEFEDAD